VGCTWQRYVDLAPERWRQKPGAVIHRRVGILALRRHHGYLLYISYSFRQSIGQVEPSIGMPFQSNIYFPAVKIDLEKVRPRMRPKIICRPSFRSVALPQATGETCFLVSICVVFKSGTAGNKTIDVARLMGIVRV